MATQEITISKLELADEILGDMNIPVDTATETRAVTLKQLRAWLGSALPVGSVFASVGRLDDERFTLLDGKTISRIGTYEAFCNKVIEKVQAGTWKACTEKEFNLEVSETGQCGKFVVSNDYVRIPKLGNSLCSGVMSGTIPVVGNGMTLGLSSGTGILYGLGERVNATSVMSCTSGTYGQPIGTTSGGTEQPNDNKSYGITTDPTKSGIEGKINSVEVFYYMVISTKEQTANVEIDINKVYEDLETRATQNLSNIPSNIDYVVENYNDGANWYRVYKSGWIEQGGLVNNGTAAADWSKVVNLLKPLSTNAEIGHYTLVVSDIGTSNDYARTCSAKLLNETSFTILSGMTWARDNRSQYVCWRACGWGQSI